MAHAHCSCCMWRGLSAEGRFNTNIVTFYLFGRPIRCHAMRVIHDTVEKSLNQYAFSMRILYSFKLFFLFCSCIRRLENRYEQSQTEGLKEQLHDHRTCLLNWRITWMCQMWQCWRVCVECVYTRDRKKNTKKDENLRVTLLPWHRILTCFRYAHTFHWHLCVASQITVHFIYFRSDVAYYHVVMSAMDDRQRIQKKRCEIEPMVMPNWLPFIRIMKQHKKKPDSVIHPKA